MAAITAGFATPNAVFLSKLLASVVLPTLTASFVLFKWRPALLIKIMERVGSIWYGFSTNYLTLKDGFTFAYLERGSRSTCKHTVVMLHGFTGDKSEFNTLSQYLPKKDFHLIAVNLPGHGGTTCDLENGYKLDQISMRIRQFIEEIGLNGEKYHLVGFSFGGMLSGIYANTYPDEIKSLSLMAPAGFKPRPSAINEQSKAYSKARSVFIQDCTIESLKAGFREFNPDEKFPPDFIMAGVVQLRNEARPYTEKVFDEILSNVTKYELEERLETMKSPTLLMWGMQDKLVHYPDEERIRKEMKSLKKFVIFNECSHLINWDQPKACANAIQNHVETYSD